MDQRRRTLLAFTGAALVFGSVPFIAQPKPPEPMKLISASEAVKPAPKAEPIKAKKRRPATQVYDPARCYWTGSFWTC